MTADGRYDPSARPLRRRNFVAGSGKDKPGPSYIALSTSAKALPMFFFPPPDIGSSPR
jgi:hypothetical protein